MLTLIKRKKEERYADFVEYEKIQKACNRPTKEYNKFSRK